MDSPYCACFPWTGQESQDCRISSAFFRTMMYRDRYHLGKNRIETPYMLLKADASRIGVGFSGAATYPLSP